MTPTGRTISAYGDFAGLDEDWTKVSEQPERRKIQNRIAQRAHRQKAKRKLEELKRRAEIGASGSEKTSPTVPPTQQYTPSTQHEEHLFPPPFDDRERSYSAYPDPRYALLQPYSNVTTTESYLSTAVPVTLPSMQRSPQEGCLPDNMCLYINCSPQDEGSNPQTPPLSHSFNHSADCSESRYEHPTTPLSIPGSPGLAHDLVFPLDSFPLLSSWYLEKESTEDYVRVPVPIFKLLNFIEGELAVARKE